MKFSFNKLVGVSVMFAASIGAGAAHADQVAVGANTAVVTLSGLDEIKSLFGATNVSTVGAATLGLDGQGFTTFNSTLTSGSVVGTGPGPVTLGWAASDGIVFSGSMGTFTLTGLAFHGADSTVSADINFSTQVFNQNFSFNFADVEFMKVTPTLAGVIQFSNDTPPQAILHTMTDIVASATPAMPVLQGSLAVYASSQSFSNMLTGLQVPANTVAAIMATNGKTIGSINVTPAVPEPSAILSALAGLGVLGFALRRRAA